MNANEYTRTNLKEQEEVIELGVASVETMGGTYKLGEPMGLENENGISEE